MENATFLVQWCVCVFILDISKCPLKEDFAVSHLCQRVGTTTTLVQTIHPQKRGTKQPRPPELNEETMERGQTIDFGNPIYDTLWIRIIQGSLTIKLHLQRFSTMSVVQS